MLPPLEAEMAKIHGTPFCTIVCCTLIDFRAVQSSDEYNMPEFRVDFPAFSGDYCLTSTSRGFGWRPAMANKL